MDLALPHRPSTPDRGLYDYLLPFDQPLRRGRVHPRRLRAAGPPVPVREIAPTIDPLAPKNMKLSAEDATYIVRQFGIDVERPLLLQVSRFDPWKDPLGVVRRVPRRQGEAPGRAAGARRLHGQRRPGGLGLPRSASSPTWATTGRLHPLQPRQRRHVEINAFQSHADVIIQKSTREGFGLTVAEGLWKGRPVIGGDVGGIPLQIEDGVTGYLVSSAAECAERCLQIMDDPARHREMALLGKEKVRREFLTPRLLRDDLRLFANLESGTVRAWSATKGAGVEGVSISRSAASWWPPIAARCRSTTTRRKAGRHARPRRPGHRPHRGPAPPPRHVGGGGAERRRARLAAEKRAVEVALDGEEYRVRYVTPTRDAYHQVLQRRLQPDAVVHPPASGTSAGTRTSAPRRWTPGTTATWS